MNESASLPELDPRLLFGFSYVFSQSPALQSSNFISEAGRRGLDLDANLLRALYLSGELSPLVRVTSRRVGAPEALPRETRSGFDSNLSLLQHSFAKGRLDDPSLNINRRLRFGDRRTSDPPRWRNGLFYSRWQLLDVVHLRRVVSRARTHGRPGRRWVSLADSQPDRVRASLYRRWSIVLSALDARYLPEIDQDFAHLVSIDLEPWDEFRARWNALDASRALAAPAPDVRKFAETLLLMAHNIDPLGAWSQLVRRAPLEMSKTLTGDALGAVELRLAAEILLRFYEDLVRAGVAEPLPESRDFSRTYHPLGDRMSSNRIKPIDEILQDLHLSPHARVVLAVEGETEELLVPRVFDALELRQSPDLVRILCMRTDSRDLTMTVALNVAPILGQRLGDGYAMVRPPTAIIVASDPGQRWSTPQKVADHLGARRIS
jgi:hypothetical protein